MQYEDYIGYDGHDGQTWAPRLAIMAMMAKAMMAMTAKLEVTIVVVATEFSQHRHALQQPRANHAAHFPVGENT